MQEMQRIRVFVFSVISSCFGQIIVFVFVRCCFESESTMWSVINCAVEKHAVHAIDMRSCTFQLLEVE